MSSYNIYNDINSIDLILIGNPQITYFTTVYRRHTFFQIIRGTPQNVKTGEKVRVNREGAHLLKQVIVKMIINCIDSNIQPNIGTSLLDNISYRFDNDEIIEKIPGKYIEIYNQLSTKPHCKSVYTQKNIGEDIEVASGDGLNHLSYSGGVYNSSGTFSGKISIELPIPFSFSNSVGNAIPYFLSKDNELYIIATLNDDVTTFNVEGNKLQIISEHIVLSETEKSRFAKNNSEYILTRIYEVDWLEERLSISQQNSYNSVKTLIWVKNNTADNSFSANNYSFSIKINNMNITPYLNYQYYTRVFPKKAGLIGYGRGLSSDSSMVCVDDSICYYTFGLKEGFDNEFDSPNGSINTSINQLELFKHGDTDLITLYMLSYDIITYQKSGAPPILKFSPKKLHD